MSATMLDGARAVVIHDQRDRWWVDVFIQYWTIARFEIDEDQALEILLRQREVETKLAS